MTLRPWTRLWTSGPTPSTFWHDLQVQPDVYGPYEAPKTAADVADASDASRSVLDVLEAGNFVQNVVQTHADIRADVLRASGGTGGHRSFRKWTNQSFFPVVLIKSAPNISCAFLKNSGFMQCANIQKKVNNVAHFTISQPLQPFTPR